MTECFIQHEDDGAKCRCDNCGTEYRADELEMISDIQERINPGCEVPAGQCPDEECGALCYLAEPPEWTLSGRFEKMNGFAEQVARMSPYSIDSSDDKLEDAVATMNRLIADSRKLTGIGQTAQPEPTPAPAIAPCAKCGGTNFKTDGSGLIDTCLTCGEKRA